jgi:hypothetical protein
MRREGERLVMERKPPAAPGAPRGEGRADFCLLIQERGTWSLDARGFPPLVIEAGERGMFRSALPLVLRGVREGERILQRGQERPLRDRGGLWLSAEDPLGIAAFVNCRDGEVRVEAADEKEERLWWVNIEGCC